MRDPYAAKACDRCRTRKKRCLQWPEGEGEGRVGCKTCGEAGAVCSIVFQQDAIVPTNTGTPKSKPATSSTPSPSTSPSSSGSPCSSSISLSPSSPSAILSTQQLSYSLIFHLVTLHIKHRPRVLNVGDLIIGWDSFGDDIARVAGKENELPLLQQAMVGLCLCDGARVSTHSAIVGSSDERLPEYGSFKTVDDRIVGLAFRRQSAFRQLEQRAIDFLDVLLPSFSEEDNELKLMFLWLYTAIIDSEDTREHCRQARAASTKLAATILRSEDLDPGTRHRVTERAVYILVNELVRSALFDSPPSTSREDFLLITQFLPGAAPLYMPSSEALDVIFDPASTQSDVGKLRGALYLPCLINTLRALYDFFYPANNKYPGKDIIRLWIYLDGFFAWAIALVNLVQNDSRFNSDGPRLDAIGTITFMIIDLGSAMVTITCGCHNSVLRLSPLDARKGFVVASHARLFAVLGHLDHILTLHQPYELGHRLTAISTVIRQITQFTENGLCGKMSRADFPNLFECLLFSSFSSVDAAVAVEFFEANDANRGSGFREVRKNSLTSMFAASSLVSHEMGNTAALMVQRTLEELSK